MTEPDDVISLTELSALAQEQVDAARARVRQVDQPGSTAGPRRAAEEALIEALALRAGVHRVGAVLLENQRLRIALAQAVPSGPSLQAPAPKTPGEVVEQMQAAAEHRVEPARLELPPAFTTCPGCAGTGKQPVTAGGWAVLYPDCPQCMGTGRAWVVADPPRVVQPPAVPGECEECDGHGVRHFPTRLCSACAGTGRDTEASVLSEAALVATLSPQAYAAVRNAVDMTHNAGWSARDVMTSCRAAWRATFPGEVGVMMALLHRAQPRFAFRTADEAAEQPARVDDQPQVVRSFDTFSVTCQTCGEGSRWLEDGADVDIGAARHSVEQDHTVHVRRTKTYTGAER